MRAWFALCLLLMACSPDKPTAELPARPIGAPVAIPPPLGLPALPFPEDNPPTAEAIALGEKLYFSKLLSVDGTVSCASCHNPQKGFADGAAVATGVGGRKGVRSSPTVLNAAFNQTQFWDGRALALEAQAAGPILNPLEMAHSEKGVVERISADPELRRAFAAAFGPAPDPKQSPVTLARITAAIASFERTLLSARSPFDRYFYGGEKSALSPAAVRGLRVFRDPGKGNCAACHRIEQTYALFTDHLFHNLGVGVNAEGELTDLGRYEVTKREADKGAFRTPTLRNIALTAPYMHDGSLRTLKEVVDFYVGGGNANPQRDPLIQPLTHLSGQERADLVAFLESLTGELPSR